MTSVNVRNVLVLLGILLTAGGVLYFAVEFGQDLSEWGRVLDLALLSVVFIALGVHFGRAGDSTEVVERSGWRWLRVTNALYMLGSMSAFAATMAFLFGVETLRPVYKVFIAIAAGLALLFVAAGRRKR